MLADSPTAEKGDKPESDRLGKVAGQAKRGRPRIHPDRKAYKAMKERERRARLKLAH